MPRDLPPNPVELRCPRCRAVVGHSDTPREAPVCADCARLLPLLTALAGLEGHVAACQDALARQSRLIERIEERGASLEKRRGRRQASDGGTGLPGESVGGD